MKRYLNFLWPTIGLGAVALSLWLLFRELRGMSLGDVESAFSAISAGRWVLAVASTLIAYLALAWYDRIALLHLGFKLPWSFISAVSFTTYALSHNIGMSMFSGAMVRYRAYSTKGLTITDVGILVAFCSFTFALGTVLLGGFVLLYEPDIIDRLFHVAPILARLVGGLMLAMVALYVIGGALRLRPLVVGKFKLVYPGLPIVGRQLLAGPARIDGRRRNHLVRLTGRNEPRLPRHSGRFPGVFFGGAAEPRPGRPRGSGTRLRQRHAPGP